MPGFSKDTMRTTLCTIVFLFSLPWNLNGHLTTSYKSIEVTNTEAKATGQDYPTDPEKENVVSFSKRIERLYLTSHSVKQSIRSETPNSEDEASNQRMKRTTWNEGHRFTTLLAQTKRQIKTRQRDQQKSTHRPQTTYPLETKNTTELNVSTKTPCATGADVLSEEKTSSGPSEALEAIQVSLSRSAQMQYFTSDSERQGIHPGTPNGEDETSHQRTKRNILNVKQNLLVQPESQTMQEEVTTPQKEQQKPTGNSHRPHTTFPMKIENATKFNILTIMSKKTRANVSPGTSSGPSEALKPIQGSITTHFQTHNFTSQSEQQESHLRTLNSEDETSNQRTKRNLRDTEPNLTSSLAQSEKQIRQEVATTPGNEQRETTESTQRQQTISPLENGNTTEFNISTKPQSAIKANVSTIETTSKKLSETHETTPFTSAITRLHGDNNVTEDIYTSQPTMETTDQPSAKTYDSNSSLATTDFTVSVGTNDVKPTKTEVTDKWTSIQAKILITTKKTTKTQIYPASKDKQQANPGPTVAGVIGTTFFLMFIAIFVILVQKRKMQKRQLENPEWAGPSPFLNVDVQPNLPNMDESGAINRQGFNQMSISRYLSNRLSKHLTLSRNTSEEVLMGDILQGSTFGRKNPDEDQAPNGKSSSAQDPTETEVNNIQQGQASVYSSDTKPPASGQEPVTESKESEQTDDLTPSLSSGTDTIIKPYLPLESIDLDSLSEDVAPLQTSDGGIVPPAPPLP